MRNRVPLLLAVVALSLGLSSATVAQVASPPAHDTSLLAALGLPGIDLVATDDAVDGIPATLEAGQYLVSLENQTADQEVELYIVQLPAGVTTAQADKDLNSGDFPSWGYDAVWAGGPNTYGGQTDAVAVTLGAGDWWFGVQRYGDNGDGDLLPSTSASVTVTAAATVATPAAPEGAVTIGMTEYAFEIPDGIAAGQQVWSLTAKGEQPHLLVLSHVPDGTTVDQVAALVASFGTGTPAAVGLDFSQLQDVYDSTIVSTGQSELVQVDLDPGTYVALCFVPDKETGAPHAAMGMITVFTVS